MNLKPLFSLALCALALSACSDDNYSESSEAGRVYQYSTFVPNEDGTTQLVLDSLTANVSSVSGLPNWCSAITQSGTTETGAHPVLTITHTATAANTATEGATAILSMENGSIVKLGLSQAYLYKSSDNGANEEFINDWENQQTVQVLSGGSGTQMSKTIYLPWATKSLSTLPQQITEDIKKEDGWSMAFCVLNELENANYFGLYNKYLGVLRVFCYIEEAAGTTSDYIFEVNLGNSANDQYHTAYYNTQQYAIPMSHTRLASNSSTFTVNGTGGQAFRMYSTPHNATSSTALQKGWTAFDIDMSAYSPDNNFFAGKSTDTGLVINVKSWSNASINMQGNLSANITGEYDEPSTKVTTNGIGTLVNLLKTTGNIAGAYASAVGDIHKIQAGIKKSQAMRPTRSLAVAAICVSAAIKIGSYIYDNFFSDASIESTEYSRGQVDLNLTGSIALTGSITQTTSNNIPVLQFQKSEFLGGDSHVGEGVWSLDEDPVIYVVGDQCLAEKSVNLYKDGDHSYDVVEDATDLQLRMCQIFDPTSIKVNINKEVYGDVSDVVVDAYYGIYPTSPMGHTAAYRKAVGIEAPDYIPLVDHSKYAKGKVIRNANLKMKPCYSNLYRFNSTYYGESTKSQFVEEASSDSVSHRLYGYKEDFSSTSSFMPAPQVLFPVNPSGTHVYDSPVPDYVVCVTVSFRAGGKTYVFSNRFIPKVVLLTGDNVKTKYNEMQAYYTKAKNGSAINTLANDGTTPVYHLHGADYIQKDLNILSYLVQNRK